MGRSKYLNQYQKEHYVHINLTIKPEEKSLWKEWAEISGKTLTGLIRDALTAYMDRDPID